MARVPPFVNWRFMARLPRSKPDIMTSRRNFFKQTGLVGASLVFPSVVPSRVFGQQAPSNRVYLGHIGVGGQGGGLLQGMMGQPLAQSVAVCDPIRERREAAARRVDQYYAEQRKQESWKGCKRLQRLPRTAGPAGHRRRGGRHAGPLARAGGAGRRARRQGRLRGEAARHQHGAWTRPCAKRCTSTAACSNTARSSARSTSSAALPASCCGTATWASSRPSTSWRPMAARRTQRRRQPVPEGIDYDLWLGPAP